MNVTIVGTGYVGLVTGTCLAEVGNHVVCVDSDRSKIDGLNHGELPIHEPGLDEMVLENIQTRRLTFTTDIRTGVTHGEIIFIAVGTPPDEDGGADLQHVLAVAREVGSYMAGYRIVVTKSTVPVGTADKVRNVLNETLRGRNLAPEFSVVSNPEFLKEGAAVDDFMKPDRIVVGTDDERAVGPMRALYAPFNRSHDRMIVMDVRSAELTKYAANSLLATKISFMNEMANLAEHLGADIESVRQGIGSDPRIGYHFIYPGCGYGGSCFPKDVQALQRSAGEAGYDTRILKAVEEVNNRQKFILLEKMDRYFGAGGLKDASVALWGLAFKPDTDDMREAPSRVLLEGLWERGARVAAFDPVALQEARRIYGDRDDLVLVDDPYQALHGAHALAIVTEWKIFRSPNFKLLKERMTNPVIFDGRNIFDPEQMRHSGFHYQGIGRANHA